MKNIPDSKVHGSNMGPTWVLSAPDVPHVGPWTLLSGMAKHIHMNTKNAQLYLNITKPNKQNHLHFSWDICQASSLMGWASQRSRFVFVLARFPITLDISNSSPGIYFSHTTESTTIGSGDECLFRFWLWNHNVSIKACLTASRQ